MKIEQAYAEGFLKRASEYGLSYSEALELFKTAATGNINRFKVKTANNNLTLSGTPNLETTAITINPPTANIGTGPQREAIQKGTDNLARGVVSETLPLAFGGVAGKALALGGNAAKINRGAELVKQVGNFQTYENSEKDTVDKMLFTAGALPLPFPAELAVVGASLGKNIYDASKIYRDNLDFRPPGGSSNNQTFSTPFKPTPPNIPHINNNNIMLAQQNLKKQSAAYGLSAVEALAILKTAEKPGLWANIRAKRARGEKPAKPGDEDYPDKKQWNKLTKAAVAAWQRSEGKNPEGGLNAKGRASYKRETGGTLKAPVTESNPKGERAKRQNSFCSRMCGMKRVNTGSKAQSDPDSRINKSLRKWNCKCGEAHDSIIEKIACNLK